MSPSYSEHKSRFAASSQYGLLRVEVIRNSIPTYLLENGYVIGRTICFQIIQSNSKIFCLENRPTQSDDGINATAMKPGNSIRISPVFDNNSEITLQNSNGEFL